jgi:hypothetical protein
MNDPLLYYPFPLNCFDKLKQFTLEFMNQFEGDNIYVKNIPLSKELEQLFYEEMRSYGLDSTAQFLAFKRRNCLVEAPETMHVDWYTAQNKPMNASLILPLDGCENTYQYWYKGEYKLELVQGTHFFGNYAKLIWLSEPEFLGKVEIFDTPMLTRVNLPHSALSRNDGSYRTVLTIRLTGNDTMEQILNTRFSLSL